MPLPRGSGSSLMRHKPNCPCPPVCFLVFAFRVGLGANRFAVGNFRRMNHQFHVIPLAQLRHHDFDVLLPGAAEQKFLGLRIAPKAQRQILFQDSVNRDADAVFVRARFRFHRKCNRRFRNPRRRAEDRRVLVAQCFAGGGFLQFRDGADITGVQLAHFRPGFPLHHLDVLKSFLRCRD